MSNRGKNRHVTPDDLAVSRAVMAARIKRGTTQCALAKRIGVSWQLISKYECGYNRIPATRLWQISLVLDIPIQAFFSECRP